MEEYEQRLTDYSQLNANIEDYTFIYKSESKSEQNQSQVYKHEIEFQQILNKLPKDNHKDIKMKKIKIEGTYSFESDSIHKQNYSFPSTRPSLKKNIQNNSEFQLCKNFKLQMSKYQKILSQKQIIIQQLWNRLEKVQQQNFILKNKISNYRKNIRNQLSESNKFKGYNKKSKDWASWTLNKKPPRPIR